jgi:hypothetical protein
MQRSFSRPALVATLGALWLCGVALGFQRLWSYAATPGEVTSVATRWPDTHLDTSPGHAQLVMVVHPECSCSRASVYELARIMAHVPDDVDATVVVDVPAGMQVAPSNALIRSARAIPRVRVEVDPDGSAASRFGVRVSGQTLLYDASGALLFAGGITGGRGHTGDNPGEDALAEAIRTRTASTGTPRTFGCILARGSGE